MIEEEWRPVTRWEGVYEVSETGKIRSLERTAKIGYGSERIVREKVLKPRPTQRGYSRYALQKDGKIEHVSAHRAVAEAFIPNPALLPYVLHRDDDPENNTVENLRWGDASDNGFDAVRNGVHPQSKKTHCPRGHEYNQENTHIHGTTLGRVCRVCRRDDAREKLRLEKDGQYGTGIH